EPDLRVVWRQVVLAKAVDHEDEDVRLPALRSVETRVEIDARRRDRNVAADVRMRLEELEEVRVLLLALRREQLVDHAERGIVPRVPVERAGGLGTRDSDRGREAALAGPERPVSPRIERGEQNERGGKIPTRAAGPEHPVDSGERGGPDRERREFLDEV